jgi:hypothetical protein
MENNLKELKEIKIENNLKKRNDLSDLFFLTDNDNDQCKNCPNSIKNGIRTCHCTLPNINKF